MFKKLILTSFLLFSSFLIIYPSKKENTNFSDYCFSLEKIISRNSVEKSQTISKNFKPYVKNITSFGTNKTQGVLINKIIDQFKISKKSYLLSFVPNKFYCFFGYWIEEISPGTVQSIFYEKSKQKINQYRDIRNEVDEFIKDINSEYKSIKKEINEFF